jgi:DNA-binding response OmpR family regulator
VSSRARDELQPLEAFIEDRLGLSLAPLGTKHVRSNANLQDMPLVIVTSLSSTADRQRAAQAGAGAYIVKGEFDQRQLLQTVASLMVRRHTIAS